ncbi:protein jagged-1b [Bacillus rossius redtenbacheri]|uniref:protein jagged-1b n=1 Tax=Bacillus rossius redtenbacheri TaxID=93214 RepID=UPI002FDCB127
MVALRAAGARDGGARRWPLGRGHRQCLLYLLLLLVSAEAAQASGYFELQILEIANYRGELADGGCCGAAERRDASLPCPRACATFFRVCLKEYQSNVTSAGPCSFGNASSPVLGGASFSIPDPDGSAAKMVLPFTFRWTRSFTLILQAMDLDNSTLPATSRVIEEATYSGIILPSADWHTLNHHGVTARITYRVRVQCDTHYFNSTCTKFCRPRDDKFGHYRCDGGGDKACIDGWRGANCETAVCKTGCHPIHGKCDQPGGCECRPGWRGEFCDQCTPYPGCKHGYCNGSAWQCICDTNWGGILCDQDLNYCGTHEPCANGGTCENTAPDQYLCTCPEGFSGPACETVDNPCATAPCAHGGTCAEALGQFHCTCTSGWTGATCRDNVDECASAPCQNSGTCVDLVDGFQCECPSGWEGNACQFDADECQGSPCINAYSCQNLVGDYRCKCQQGWAGKNCDHNINDCVGQCQHGATCIDLVNDYHCACQPGYTGRDCHTDIDDCESNPCKNGGECSDQVNGYRCICPVGFMGEQCEVDHDHCSPNPCDNGAPCFNTQGDYYCHCPEDWQGKNCSSPRTHCSHPPCEVVDSCTVPAPSNSSAGGAMLVPSGICGEHGACLSLSAGGFQCSCDAGYTGKYCHENINDCKQNPCQNGGTCVDKVNSFQCICKEGWEGEICTINRNECSPNPCRNNGSCSDGVADFVCACRDGWKGKTCNLKDSHCDRSTCRNGGTCQDLGDTYVCLCPADWEGTTCHIGKTHACKSNPCQNGATCVNTGDLYSCICKEGFEGQRCEHDTNDCSPPPCFNGGRCVDGVNWFRCECAPGFAGPDCRINVNECASGPCGFGSTCVDGIGAFRCVCPPGRTGQRCEGVEDMAFTRGSCLWRGQYFAGNATWQHGCNTCVCRDSVARCTRVWCGLGNCLGHPNLTVDPTTCLPSQVCVPSPGEACLAPPCAPWGECRDLQSGKRVGPPLLPAPPSCWPNQAALSDACARLTLLLDRSRLARGLSTEGLCLQLRRLAAARQASAGARSRLVLLCDLKQGSNDTVEVTMSTLSPSAGSEDDHAVTEGIRVLGEFISRKQTNLSALTSIVEVKVETALVSGQKQGNGYMIALICIVLMIAACLLLCGLYYWHSTWRRGEAPGGGGGPRCDDEKSNNLQNEENLRRYVANPLKDEAPAKSATTSVESLAETRVSVGRPLPADASAETLEMTPEPDPAPEPSPRRSRILLYKARGPDVRNNTAAFDDAGAHKDFGKRVINLRVLPPVQRTLQPAPGGEMLTVIV